MNFLLFGQQFVGQNHIIKKFRIQTFKWYTYYNLWKFVILNSQLTDYRLMRFLYVILDILEPLKIITKMAESQSVTMPYLRKVIDEQLMILESLKNTQVRMNEILKIWLSLLKLQIQCNLFDLLL